MRRKQQMAFKKLKLRLPTMPMLKFLNFTKPFEVHIDENGFAICGVLMQDGHPIVFENKKHVRAQIWWPTHEKQLFAIVNCFKAWQNYLGTHKT